MQETLTQITMQEIISQVLSMSLGIGLVLGAWFVFMGYVAGLLMGLLNKVA